LILIYEVLLAEFKLAMIDLQCSFLASDRKIDVIDLDILLILGILVILDLHKIIREI
jgi:hypothetical protein